VADTRWAAVGLWQLLGDTRSCRVVMPAVATDHDTPAGWCPLTHTQLQVVRLSADERLAMRTALYQLAEEKVTANSARRGSKVHQKPNERASLRLRCIACGLLGRTRLVRIIHGTPG